MHTMRFVWTLLYLYSLQATAFSTLFGDAKATRSKAAVNTGIVASSNSDAAENNAQAINPMSSRSIPKVETGVLDLLQKRPEADGRGVKIAIMDTGCDLAAAGLQETSTGLPKYLDFLDCTGDNDIDMSKVVVDVPQSNYTIQGLSGRDLKLNPGWAPSKVQLGGARLYELIPRPVQRRLKQERKAIFENHHHRLIAQIQQNLDRLQSEIDSCNGGNIGDDGDNETKTKLIKRRKDEETLLEQFQKMLEDYDDPGPYLDIIVFQDENDHGTYKAVIDLDATGDLTQAVPIAPFGHSRQMGELGFGSAVTFCIQIYDEGKTLSIVTDAGSHGTHVAAISAANYGPNDIKNGVAPGAQILACKIGDGRLGSAETGTGLIRALIAAKKYGCDLVNLSYGEPSWQPDSGRVAEVFADATYKWGMTVFTSAGNDGPALSSLGSPGTLTAPITVGAYVSQDMLVDQYSTLPLPTDDDDDDTITLQDASYYFSSRGPTPDGAFPDICAPGGAIASIPRHTLRGKAQMHGTSMSSPNACGVAACVLSALKQEGIVHCSPAELRRGLVNSAASVDIVDQFAQGAGLISAPGAVDYILKHHGKLGQDLAFDIRIPSRNHARGIYIRDSLELDGPMTFNIEVIPRFNHALVRTQTEMDELLSLELDLELTSSESWVTCPKRLSLLSTESFSVRLATKDLAPGVHFSTVTGIDSSDPSRGPLFQVPITVVVPHSTLISRNNEKADLNKNESVSLMHNGIDVSMTYKLKPGVSSRRFLEVPPLAEWVTFKIRSTDPNPSTTSPQRILLHAIPFVRGDLPNTRIQLKRIVAVTEGVEKAFSMKVKGGSTLELCLQLLYLASPSAASLVADVEFHSLNARPPTLISSQPLVIPASQGFARFGASSNLRSENLSPKASLDTVHRTLRPSTYEISSGSVDRDVFPPSDAELKANSGLSPSDGTEIYNMFLRYSFIIDTEEPVKVTPRITSFFNQLYDSPIDSQIWELRDSNSQLLECGSSMHDANAASLAKGNYTLTFHTRHPSRQFLEQIKDTPFQLLIQTDPLDCKIYSELDKASTPAVTGDGRTEVGARILRKGSFQDLYVARPTGDLPSWVAPGDVLAGKVILDNARATVTDMALLYQIPPKVEVKKLNENKLPENNNGVEKTMEEIMFDSKISYLSQIRSKDDNAPYKELAGSLLKENSTSLALFSELLAYGKELKVKNGDPTKPRLKELQNIRKMLSASNGGPIDESALAEYFGVAPPSDEDLQEDQEAANLKKQMEDQKTLLQSCLLAITSSLSNLVVSSETSSTSKEFDVAVKELKKWAPDSTAFPEPKDKLLYVLIISRHMRICKDLNGAAISILMEACKEISNLPESYKEISNELLVIYDALDCTDHVTDYTKNTVYKRFPPSRT